MITYKNIVITGASSGIGMGVLKLLMQGAGNRILAVARHTESLQELGENVIPFACDVSSAEGVEKIFEKAESLFGKIDIFYANAGFPYYEQFTQVDWEHIQRIYNTNAISPIYTYARYIKHLNGREGQLAYTISAMGQMAMPGYALYTSTKFAMHGFQQAIRLEKPKNLTVTCLYPVATATNFFNVANKSKFDLPFPVQKTEVVARKMVEGLERGKSGVSPCGLFNFAKVLMTVAPVARTVYWKIETGKFNRFLKASKDEGGKS